MSTILFLFVVDLAKLQAFGLRWYLRTPRNYTTLVELVVWVSFYGMMRYGEPHGINIWDAEDRGDVERTLGFRAAVAIANCVLILMTLFKLIEYLSIFPYFG